VQVANRQIEQARAANPDARDLVMRGLAIYGRPDYQVTRQEADLAFEQALQLDPESVDGRIGIARSLVFNLGSSSSVEQDEARIELLLDEVVKRDPNNAIAPFIMGVLRRFQNRLTEAQVELERAISLDRNNAPAYQQLGWTQTLLGRPEAAIPNIEKSIRLSPQDPYIAHYYAAL